MTEKVMNDICAALSNHQTMTAACALAGAKRRTVLDWLEKGANEMPRHDGGSPTYVEFHARVQQAIAISEGRLVQRLDKSSEGGSEKATMFLLERRHKEEWGRTEKHEHVGSAEKPIQVVLTWPGGGVQDVDSELVRGEPIKVELESGEIDEAEIVIESSSEVPAPARGGVPPERT